MPFFRQLLYLLWKNLLLRKRQKRWLIVEIVWPITLFLILLLFRLTNTFTSGVPTKCYTPKALPSVGFLPFVQSYLCTLSNPRGECLPDYSIGPAAGYKNNSYLESAYGWLSDLVEATEDERWLESWTELAVKASKNVAKLRPLDPGEEEGGQTDVASFFVFPNNLTDAQIACGVDPKIAKELTDSQLTPQFYLILIHFAMENASSPLENTISSPELMSDLARATQTLILDPDFILSLGDIRQALAYAVSQLSTDPAFRSLYNVTNKLFGGFWNGKALDRIFCNSTYLEKSLIPSGQSSVGQIGQELCGKWNCIMNRTIPFNIFEIFNNTLKAAQNLTGLRMEPNVTASLLTQGLQLLIRSRSPKFVKLVGFVETLTDAFRNLTNITDGNVISKLTCGTINNPDDLLGGGSMLQKFREEARKTVRKEVSQRAGSARPFKSGNKTEPDKPVDRIVCKNHVITVDQKEAESCERFLLEEVGLSSENFIARNIFIILRGYIFMAPDAPVVREIEKKLDNWFNSFRPIQEWFLDLMKNRDQYWAQINSSVPYVAKENAVTGLRNLRDSYDGVDIPFPETLNATLTVLDAIDGNFLNNSQLINFSKIATCFNSKRFVVVPDERTLEEVGTCFEDRALYYGGIVFPDLPHNAKTLPPATSYKLRMQNQLTDGTSSIIDRFWSLIARDRALIDLKYQTYGFSFLQESVDRAIIQLQTGKPSDQIGVYNQQFPNPCYTEDLFMRALAGMMPLFMVLSWIFTAGVIIKNVVYEKEKRLKEVMKVMGLGNLVHWLAWFIQSFAVIIIPIALLTLILWTGILVNSDPVIIFIFLVLFATATITQCFLISTFFSQANIAAAAGAILYFLLYTPYAFLNPQRQSLGYLPKILSCLVPQVAFGWGVGVVSLWEEETSGLQWSNIDKSPIIFMKMDFLTVLYMLAADTAIHILLTWYIEAVFPGAYGMPRPLYFPFQLSYWFGTSSTKSIRHDESVPEENQLVEPVSEPEEIGVKVQALRKVYGSGKVALDRLSVSFFKGQITAFLGHNGAGKTTTMSILTGLFPPTSGTVFVNGKDIRKDFDLIRTSLGMCPQYNCLFDNLSVEEQLTFYAGLKGVNRKDLDAEVDSMLHDVGLPNKKMTLAADLSGGMQRKLSVAIAFIGGSKTVILDEPTAGVDPHARRGIWDLLVKHKEGRTIIMSTHHMDEADLLGDRIAIINHGKLECAGSSMFLKRKFGLGYNLTVVKEMDISDRKGKRKQLRPLSAVPDLGSESPIPSADPLPTIPSRNGLGPGTTLPLSPTVSSSTIKAFVEKNFPGAVLKEEVVSEMVFLLPSNDPKQLGRFFELLETEMKKLPISSYGVSDTTLEEIFLRIVGSEKDASIFKPGCSCCVPLRLKLSRLINKKKENPSEVVSLNNPDMLDPKKDQPHPKVKFNRNGVSLGLLRLRALLVKRFHNFRRNLKGACAEILLPVILVAFAMFLITLIPSGANEEPALLLIPWLYNFYGPNTIFYSTDPPAITGKNEEASKILKYLQEPPGIGTRCLKNSPITASSEYYYPCERGSHQWENLENGNVSYNPKETQCRCDKMKVDELHWKCDAKRSRPPAPSIRTNSTDILLNMSGRNISLWILDTDEKYRLKRYGGFSTANVVPIAKEGKNVEEGSRRVVFLESLIRRSLKELNVINGTKSNNSVTPDVVVQQLFTGLNVTSSVKVWFNNRGWISGPAYTSVLSNSLLRMSLDDSKEKDTYGIFTYNHPLNYSKTQRLQGLGAKKYQRERSKVAFQVVLLLLAFSFVPASFVLFVIGERISHAKHLQVVSGIQPLVYWISNFIWDIVNFAIPVFLCVLIFFIFNVDAFIGTFEALTAILFLFFSFGVGIILEMYIFSFVFTVPSLAFIALGSANFFLGVITTITTITLDGLGALYPHLISANNICKSAFLFLPQYCFGRGLFDVVFNYFETYYMNTFLNTYATADPWGKAGDKCGYLLAHGVFGFAVVMLIEYRHSLIPKPKILPSKLEEDDNSHPDEDVVAEKLRIKSGDADDSALKIDGLTKVYRKFMWGKEVAAVKSLYVGARAGECFGLLGVNGAGKTTTFKMLTGKIDITAGDAKVLGMSVRRERGGVNQLIGYCPQFDALNRLLTGREQLTFYARLRGIVEKDVGRVVAWAIRHMQLTEYADDISGNYSGGNRRKLSTAVALVGNPAIVLLDEPTSGMDPKARRFTWNRILDVLKEDRTVVLTSHSMEECETLCTKLGIMVAGRLKCLGSVQHLKNKFGDGYSLTIKLSDSTWTQVESLTAFILGKFQGAALREQHFGMVEFKLPTTGLYVWQIFQTISEIKSRFSIEDYTVCQTTLDQVFLQLASDEEKKSAKELVSGNRLDLPLNDLSPTVQS